MPSPKCQRGALRRVDQFVVISGVSLATLFAAPALAQSGGGYEVTWSTIGGGGVMNASGGGYDVDGTIGQPDAGTLTGGVYAVAGGFWVVTGGAAPDPPTIVMLVCTDDLDCGPGEACIGGECGMHNNRYLSIHPPISDPGTETGIKVTVVDGPCADTVLYAASPTDYPEKDLGQPQGWFTGALLQETPVFSDWSSAADGAVHLFGAEVAPGTTYSIQIINDGDGESDPLIIKTAQWGDVTRPIAGPGRPTQPDFSDIAAIVDKFKGLGLIKAQAQLQPELVDPTKPVDFKDIGKAVDAFKRSPYPYSCSAGG